MKKILMAVLLMAISTGLCSAETGFKFFASSTSFAGTLHGDGSGLTGIGGGPVVIASATVTTSTNVIVFDEPVDFSAYSAIGMSLSGSMPCLNDTGYGTMLSIFLSTQSVFFPSEYTAYQGMIYYGFDCNTYTNIAHYRPYVIPKILQRAGEGVYTGMTVSIADTMYSPVGDPTRYAAQLVLAGSFYRAEYGAQDYKLTVGGYGGTVPPDFDFFSPGDTVVLYGFPL